MKNIFWTKIPQNGHCDCERNSADIGRKIRQPSVFFSHNMSRTTKFLSFWSKTRANLLNKNFCLTSEVKKVKFLPKKVKMCISKPKVFQGSVYPHCISYPDHVLIGCNSTFWKPLRLTDTTRQIKKISEKRPKNIINMSRHYSSETTPCSLVYFIHLMHCTKVDLLVQSCF